ncbi:MAG TPA: hypothetical protein VM490_01470 [Armatimonadaceae bacterium]|nr:hypothetical protein [Armatimonadaceae bacterium]
MSKRRRTLYALTIAVMAALFALPATRWLVRAQVGPALGLRSEAMTQLSVKPPAHLPEWGRAESWQESVRRVSAAAPGDFGIQLAAAISQSDGERAKSLRDLCARFPGEPAAHAALLRLATQNGDQSVAVGHVEDQDALAPPRNSANRAPANPAPAAKSPSADILASFDGAAEAGERLDPDNAYFPAMRAVGYFAAGRDADAVAALERAGRCSHWNEYISEEMRGRWDLAHAAYGSETGSLARMATAFSTLFPHYAQLRAAARVATVRAMRAEAAGDAAGGIAIRKSVARLGATMRVQASSLIGSLVGQAITGVAAERPGGSPAVASSPEKAERTERAQIVTREYAAFLQTHGEGREATWYRAEREASERVRGITKRAMARTFLLVPEMESVLALWGVGQALLANAALVLLFGGVYLVLMRLSPALRDGRPLDAATKWGGTVFVLAPASAVGIAALLSADAPYLAVVAAVAAAGIAVAVPAFRARLGVRGLLRGTGVAALLALTAGIAAASIMVQVANALWPFQLFNGLAETGANGTSFLMIAVGSVLICGGLPLLLHLGLVAVARPLRLPVSHVVARGVTALAGPIACLLLLGYAAVALVTVQREAVAIRSLHQLVEHEGRLLAAMVGEEWPGATPRP